MLPLDHTAILANSWMQKNGIGSYHWKICENLEQEGDHAKNYFTFFVFRYTQRGFTLRILFKLLLIEDLYKLLWIVINIFEVKPKKFFTLSQVFFLLVQTFSMGLGLFSTIDCKRTNYRKFNINEILMNLVSFETPYFNVKLYIWHLYNVHRSHFNDITQYYWWIHQLVYNFQKVLTG